MVSYQVKSSGIRRSPCRDPSTVGVSVPLLGLSGGLPPQTLTLKRPISRAVVVMCLLAWALILLAGATTGGAETTPSPIQRVLCVAALLPTLWAVYRCSRMEIVASPQGLTIRNLFRNHEIAWTEIQDLNDPPRYGALRRPGMRVVLADGTIVSATLLALGQLSDPGPHGYTAKVVEEFRRYFQQAKSQTVGS